MNIYVGNLSYQTNDGDLKRAFEAHGEVASASVIMDQESGRSKGFGFVEMPNAQEAQKAIQAIDGSEIDGRQIKANEARPKADRSSGGPRGGGRGGDRGGDRGGRDRW